MDIPFKKVSVIGLGKSGMAAVRFFVKRGVKVFTSDSKLHASENPLIKELKRLHVDSEWGYHTAKVLESDLIVLSPGVEPHLPILDDARERSIPIWPEIEVAYRYCPGKLIAITGTVGKSTVAALVGHLMNRNGMDARVVGNIGTPLLDELELITENTWAVMEVSSFQLETIVQFHSQIACIITITQDHLNRHPSQKSYLEAKARILENQTADELAVLNLEDPVVRSLVVQAKGKVLWFGTEPLADGVFLEDRAIYWHQGSQKELIATIDQFRLPGAHNLRNLTAAAAICYAAGLKTIHNGIDDFQALPHRLEWVKTIGGIDYYDDSKGTNSSAVAAALDTFDRPVVLIAGGHDKNLDLTPLINAAQNKVKALVALGKDNSKILNAFSFLSPESKFDCHDINEAVLLATKQAKPGDVVLLSPGCASFDLFQSAEERGDKFQEAVRALPS